MSGASGHMMYGAPVPLEDYTFRANDAVAEDGSHVIGTVLNNWDPRSNGYGSYPDRYHRYHSS